MRPRSDNAKSSGTAALRVRAAWLYHVYGLTQSEVADRLEISRATTIRLLDEAKKRNEVTVWVTSDANGCAELSLAVQAAFGLRRVIVVPSAGRNMSPHKAVGAALGRFLSEHVVDGMTVGVGWGRTLNASLDTFQPMRRNGVSVVSLLGGSINPTQINPVEYSWRLSSLMGADCLLFLSPLIVDSLDTKRRLLDKCGLDRIDAIAAQLDLAVVSCGSVDSGGTSLALEHITAPEIASLRKQGCVGDILCNFLDRQGRTVANSISERVMAVDLDVMSTARHIVLATGGADRAAALVAGIRRLKPATLITDEAAARTMLTLQDED
ncbi:sugar-binding transcriptional regulator [Shinella daejeonensis]|uniref:sugar-binding transcriptional regulator n=1 Tax=Shinella daejeonensis TaxID=659017 RepID=UPI0020C7DA9D|nr:sugar-binding transcriptional regulator [Shinella daejeonensis]